MKKGKQPPAAAGKETLSPAAFAETTKSESSAAEFVAVQTATSAAALAALAEARKGQAGPTAMGASDASSGAAEQAATTGVASLPVAPAGAGMSAVAAPPASVPMASAGVKMAAVAAPPVVVTSCAGTQPNHFRAGPEELPKTTPDVEPLIRRAASYRVKFRRNGGLISLPLQQVGFHPQNRDGQPPNGDRCASLCVDILKLGFDKEEANAGAICVEQRPACHTFADFNKAACDGDDYHAPVDSGVIAFGSLSHSHLHQVLKNIAGGMPGTAKAILDSSGKYSLSMLRTADPAFAAAVDTGLTWDILVWQMEVEEPEACSVIQAAMNSKAALFLLTHEMQAFSQLCSLAASMHSSRIFAATDVEFIRCQLARTMPQFAADAHFLDMYKFIVDIGCHDAPFVKDLMAFHQQFVDPKIRRLRLNAFATMSEFGLKFPHLKIAGLKHAYSCDAKRVQHGFCEPVNVKTVKDAVGRDGQVCEHAEDILRWFHVDGSRHNEDSTRGCGVTMDFSKLLGVLDREVFGALVGSRGDNKLHEVFKAGHKAYVKLAAVAPTSVIALSPYPFQTGNGASTDVETASARSRSSPVDLAPKIIQYIGGKAVTAQDVMNLRTVNESLKWRDFMESDELQKGFQDDANKAAAWLAIYRLHTSLPTQDGLAILRGGEPKGVRVVAEVALKAGEMILAPLVQGSNRIVNRTVQAWALPVTIRRDSAAESTVYILGGGTLPSVLPQSLVPADAGVAEDDIDMVSLHDWKPSNFPWPFWLVKRCDNRSDANCHISHCLARSVGTMTADFAFTDACEVKVPIMINFAPIEKNQELVVHWECDTPKVATKVKEVNWFHQSKKASIKRQKT
jgi:hypothetical protein